MLYIPLLDLHEGSTGQSGLISPVKVSQRGLKTEQVKRSVPLVQCYRLLFTCPRFSPSFSSSWSSFFLPMDAVINVNWKRLHENTTRVANVISLLRATWNQTELISSFIEGRATSIVCISSAEGQN